MKFKELQLSDKILDAVEEMGYETLTPIQELAIPKILDHQDIVGLAQTGTGKTAAFALPIIDILLKEYKSDRRIKVLVLTPTRELAIQNRDNIIKYSKNTDFKCSVILGGVNQHSQVEVLKKGIDILVATPGRLVDLMNQRRANLSNVEILVLDEADTMLDMGFIKDIKTIIAATKETRQTLLFSATMPDEIKALSVSFMKNPVTIKTKTTEVTADNINQEVYMVDKNNKFPLLLELISTKEQLSTLIFTRTKHGANDLEKKLNQFDIKVSVIHGNKTQSNRVKALQDFKTGHSRIMIATDIAARGIDINDLGLVVNYDMPEQAEVYVHRIGRTARAGKNGKAISLCSSAEIGELKAIQRLIKHDITVADNKNYPMVLAETKPVRGRQSARKSSSKEITEMKKNFRDTKKSFKKDERKTFIKSDTKEEFKTPRKQTNKFERNDHKTYKENDRKPFKSKETFVKSDSDRKPFKENKYNQKSTNKSNYNDHKSFKTNEYERKSDKPRTNDRKSFNRNNRTNAKKGFSKRVGTR